MALAASVRKYFIATKIAARNSASTSRNVIAGLASTAVTLVTLFVIYNYVFAQRGEVRGITVASAIWAVAMYSLYWAIGMRNIFRDMAADVKRGAVEVFLNKPVDYILLTVAQRLGRQVWTIIVSVILIAVLLMIFAGLPPVDFSWLWLVKFSSLLVFGILLSAIAFSLIGLTAFWIDDPMPVMWIFDKSVMVLGGSIVPVAMFPSVVRLVAEWSPMGAMLSFARAFNPDFDARYLQLITSQVSWCIVFGMVTWVAWGRARKNLSIYGG